MYLSLVRSIMRRRVAVGPAQSTRLEQERQFSVKNFTLMTGVFRLSMAAVHPELWMPIGHVTRCVRSQP